MRTVRKNCLKISADYPEREASQKLGPQRLLRELPQVPTVHHGEKAPHVAGSRWGKGTIMKLADVANY